MPLPTLTIAQQILLTNLPKETKEYLRALLHLPNPAWEEAKRFNRFHRHLPQFIDQFQDTAEGFVVPRGILYHLLEDLGLEWEVIDQRVAPPGNWPLPSFALRTLDQEPAVQKLLEKDNGILAAPAGSGKTLMGLEAARRLGLKTLWLVHQTHLKDQALAQAKDKFNLLDDQIGIIHGKKDTLGEALTIGMIPTLRSRDLETLSSEFGTVVVDEAHHTPSSTFLRVITQFRAKHIYGLTATAYRRDKLEALMFGAIGPKTAEIPHAELFEEQHLMKATIRVRLTGWYPPQSHLLDYHGLMEAMVRAEGRNKAIVEDVLRECRGNPSIILVERTKHAEILSQMLLERGVRAASVTASAEVEGEFVRRKGQRPQQKKKSIPKKVREQLLSDFRNGTLQVIAATYDLLAEGFDYKPLSRLFLASPIKWKGIVTQAIGRIQRPCEGKTDAIAYDYVDEAIPLFLKQANSRYFSVYRVMGMKVENEEGLYDIVPPSTGG